MTKASTSTENTKELVNAAKRGEQWALTELYNGTSQDVYAAIRAIVLKDDIAQDLMQTTYLKAFSKLYQLKDASSFRAWVKKIATNTSFDWQLLCGAQSNAIERHLKKKALQETEDNGSGNEETQTGKPVGTVKLEDFLHTYYIADKNYSTFPYLALEMKGNTILVKFSEDGVNDLPAGAYDTYTLRGNQLTLFWSAADNQRTVLTLNLTTGVIRYNSWCGDDWNYRPRRWPGGQWW